MAVVATSACTFLEGQVTHVGVQAVSFRISGVRLLVALGCHLFDPGQSLGVPERLQEGYFRLPKSATFFIPEGRVGCLDRGSLWALGCLLRVPGKTT